MSPDLEAVLIFYALISLVIGSMWRDISVDNATGDYHMDYRFPGEPGWRALIGILIRGIFWPLAIIYLSAKLLAWAGRDFWTWLWTEG